MSHRHRMAVMVMGERWPAKAISYLDPIGRWDSGFMVVLDDVPEPDDSTDDEPVEVVCLHCLIEEHPEVGRGMDLARAHGGTVRFDGGEWVPV